jgi:hypothetical protein
MIFIHISAYSYWSTFQRLDFSYTIYKNSVRTSQETHYISVTKINWSILFRRTIALCCENHEKHIHTLRGQYAVCGMFIWNVEFPPIYKALEPRQL